MDFNPVKCITKYEALATIIGRVTYILSMLPLTGTAACETFIEGV